MVQSLSELQLTDPIDMINNSLETLLDLETHGFDVSAIRDSLNELLALKSKVGQHEEKVKKVEVEIEKGNQEKYAEEKKMLELKETMVQCAKMKMVKEEEVMRLQSKLHIVHDQMSDWEVAFRKTCSHPFVSVSIIVLLWFISCHLNYEVKLSKYFFTCLRHMS